MTGQEDTTSIIFKSPNDIEVNPSKPSWDFGNYFTEYVNMIWSKFL